MYRFKTKQEFLSEFGEGWRKEVLCVWVEGMDRYLGQDISEKYWEVCERGGSITTPGAGYSVSPDMYISTTVGNFQNGVKTISNGLLIE